MNLNFKHFLNEGDPTDAEHRRELTEGKFLELLREKAKNAHLIAQHTPFFRQDTGPDMMLVTPAAKEERSKFWVDKLIKEMPSWNRMPSRSRFIKAYTNFDRTFGGDDVYVLIPLDGTRVGVAPGASFYRSFKGLHKNLGFDRVDNKTFTDWLDTVQNSFAQLTDTKIKKYKPKTFGEFRTALKQIDKIIGEDRHKLEKNLSIGESISNEDAKIIKDLLSRHISSTERYLAEKLEPEANGFHSVRIESFSRGTGDHEVWIDFPALLIKRTAYINLHKRGSL
jgi:hypothetical protein